MADTFADALAQAIQNRATEDGDALDKARRVRSVRSPDQNNPLAPTYARPERRTRPTYRDPVGSEAVGNIDRERKNQ